MAGILKKGVGRCLLQNVAKDGFATCEWKTLRRKYGGRAKSHAKMVGLLGCYQIYHKNPSGHSMAHYPELPGKREMSSTLNHGFLVADLDFDTYTLIQANLHLQSRLDLPHSASDSRLKHVVSYNMASFKPTRTKSTCRCRSRCTCISSCISVDSDSIVKLPCPNLFTRLNSMHSGLVFTSGRVQNKFVIFKNTSGMFHSVSSPSNIGNQWQSKSNLALNGIVPIRHYASRARRPAQKKREKNYYEVLGITPNATQGQVKAAYFNLSKIHHPDKNAGCKDAQGQFAAINEAYSVLGNLTLRKRYDRGMLSQKDIHGEVSKEERAHEHGHQQQAYRHGAAYTAGGISFSEEARRQAKTMDDFFSSHYKGALDKERRERAERKQRMDEYIEMQEKAKLSPGILAVFMFIAVTLAIKSVSNSAAIDKKLREGAQGTGREKI